MNDSSSGGRAECRLISRTNVYQPRRVLELVHFNRISGQTEGEPVIYWCRPPMFAWVALSVKGCLALQALNPKSIRAIVWWPFFSTIHGTCPEPIILYYLMLLLATWMGWRRCIAIIIQFIIATILKIATLLPVSFLCWWEIPVGTLRSSWWCTDVGNTRQDWDGYSMNN